MMIRNKIFYFLLCIALAIAHAIPPTPGASSPETPPAPNTDAKATTITTTVAASDQPAPELSWQSLFWALFSLALLSMSQPSILDVEFPQSSLLFPMRGSPIVCLVDMLEVLYHWNAAYWVGDLSIQEAALEVNFRRLRDRKGGGETTLEATSVEKHPIASLILFLGAATQAVKILACEGVNWAKVAVVCYVASYGVLASVAFASRELREQQDMMKDTTLPLEIRARNETCSRIAVVGSVVATITHAVLLCFAIHAAIHSSQERKPNFDYATIVAILVFLCVTILGAVFCLGVITFSVTSIIPYFEELTPILERSDREGMWKWVSKGLITCVCCLLSAFVAYAWIKYMHAIIEIMTTFCSIIIEGGLVLLVSVGFFTSIQSCKTPRTGDMAGKWMTTSLAINNLGVALLYFSLVYDSKGTVKPAWTEKLG